MESPTEYRMVSLQNANSFVLQSLFGAKEVFS